MPERLAKFRAFSRSVELYGSISEMESVADIGEKLDRDPNLENLQGVELTRLSVVVEKILGVNGLKRAILNSFEWAQWETCIRGRDLGLRLTLGKEPFVLSFYRTGYSDGFDPGRPIGSLDILPDYEQLAWKTREGRTSLYDCGVLPRTRQVGFIGTQIIREYDSDDTEHEFIGDYDFAVILTPTIRSYQYEVIDDWQEQERVDIFDLSAGGISRPVSVDPVFQKKALARFLSGIFS